MEMENPDPIENEDIFIDSSHVSSELRTRVNEKCHGMCQANWIIDEDLDKFTNEMCSARGSTDNPLEVDHIYPRSLGGVTEFANLQILCKRHNIMKSDKVYHLHN